MSNVTHCWEDYKSFVSDQFGIGSREWCEAHQKGDATCLLPEGHEGPHEWTPDDQITVHFVDDEHCQCPGGTHD